MPKHQIYPSNKAFCLTPIITLFVILLSCHIYAGPPDISISPLNAKPPVHKTGDATQSQSFFRDLGSDFSSLIRDRDFYRIVGGTTAIPLIFHSRFATEDPEINEEWRNSRIADNFFKLGNGMGNAVYPVTAGAFSYILGVKLNNRNLQSFGSELLRAQIVTGMITLSMKALVNRTRPNGGPYSYPSGHTSTAFATAGVISSNFGPKLGIPAYALATYVGFSRLQENKHYLSDIIAGAIIGTYISHRITTRKIGKTNLTINPAIIDGAPAAAVTFHF